MQDQFSHPIERLPFIIAAEYMKEVNNITAVLESERNPLGLAIVSKAQELANHPLYYALHSIEDVRIYMNYQVWCVWDFMSLVKAIQQKVTCVSVPWLPPKDGNLAAYINEIVSSEESDIAMDGNHASHFETYLRAMHEAGADTNPIGSFIKHLQEEGDFETAIEASGAPKEAKAFVRTTINFAIGDLHQCVAAFCIGREELIPNMFTTLLGANSDENTSDAVLNDKRLATFRWYLERHIKLDSESHGPLSTRLFNSITGNDPTKREEALQSGLEALDARKKLLDATYNAILQLQMTEV